MFEKSRYKPQTCVILLYETNYTTFFLQKQNSGNKLNNFHFEFYHFRSFNNLRIKGRISNEIFRRHNFPS